MTIHIFIAVAFRRRRLLNWNVNLQFITELLSSKKLSRVGVVCCIDWSSKSILHQSFYPSPEGDGNEDTLQQVACANQNQEWEYACITNQLPSMTIRIFISVAWRRRQWRHASASCMGKPKSRGRAFALQINFLKWQSTSSLPSPLGDG